MTGLKKTLEVIRRPTDPERPTGEQWAPEIFGASDAGCVRPNNEDQFLIAKLERSVLLQQSGFPLNDGTRLRQASPWLFMVADGMGGHEGGEVASAVVIDAMAHYAFTAMPWVGAHEDHDQELVEGMQAAVVRAQERMLQVAARKGLDERLGSTLTMAYASWPNLLLFHVGDSRAYLYRESHLHQLTRDHNLAEEMVQRKVLTPDQARESRYSSVLTNALGGGSAAVHVELHRMQLVPGDLVLLCSDGLHGELSDAQIGERMAAVSGAADLAPCVRGLIDAAKAAGGRDNVTVVLARF